MAQVNRTNSFRSSSTEHADLWVDYNANNNKATALIVIDNGPNLVYGELILANGTKYSQVFGSGTTSIPLPNNSGISVGFDATDGNTAYLTGIQELLLREPA